VQVNLHDAKTHLSRYVDQALGGEEVVIARAGRPLVRLVPVEEAAPPPRRLGFLADSARAEADLKQVFAAEITAMFREAALPSSPIDSISSIICSATARAVQRTSESGSRKGRPRRSVARAK
jgi:prevent-host-death family protein